RWCSARRTRASRNRLVGAPPRRDRRRGTTCPPPPGVRRPPCSRSRRRRSGSPPRRWCGWAAAARRWPWQSVASAPPGPPARPLRSAARRRLSLRLRPSAAAGSFERGVAWCFLGSWPRVRPWGGFPNARLCGIPHAERSVVRHPPRRTLGCAASPTPNARLYGRKCESVAQGSVRRRYGRRIARSRLGAAEGAVVDVGGKLGAVGSRAAERDASGRNLLRAGVRCHGGALPGGDLLEALPAVVAAEGHRTGGLIGAVLHRGVQHRVPGHAPRGHGGNHVSALLGWFGVAGVDLHLRGGVGGALALHGSGHGESAFLGVLGGIHLVPGDR